MGITMRAEFATAMLKLFEQRQDLVFLTGDLGYMALEGVAAAFGERFINAGVAEQNAVSLAAGLARAGQLPWLYSAAVFTVLRPYEQIRNDICLHKLPVKLVGNGGGYAYGIMGATHHALEDVGALRALPNIRLYLPLVAADVASVVRTMADDPLPNYLRLGLSAKIPGDVAPFAAWRKLKPGRSCVVIGMGQVLQELYELAAPELFDELEIWSVGTLPLEAIPAELAASIRAKQRVVTIEEHYRACGLGEALSYALLTSDVVPKSLVCLHAAGYPSGRYGSQRWHLEESGLRGPPLSARLREVLRA
jgi:transketolase